MFNGEMTIEVLGSEQRSDLQQHVPVVRSPAPGNDLVGVNIEEDRFRGGPLGQHGHSTQQGRDQITSVEQPRPGVRAVRRVLPEQQRALRIAAVDGVQDAGSLRGGGIAGTRKADALGSDGVDQLDRCDPDQLGIHLRRHLDHLTHLRHASG